MGKYLLRKELGRGGMGVVYLAEDTQLGREVALKMLRPGVALGERHLELFRREARAVAALSHPNIVHINAFDMVDDALLIEMPYLTGGSLYDQLRLGLPLVRLTRILVELLRALSCCHAAGIIHRDVKPGNVLFDAADTAKLSDFGAAALVQGSWEDVQESGSTTTIFVGTPQYACPEAWSNAPPEPHWDLFALGMIVREALTGAPAVKASSPLEYIEKIIRNPPPPLSTLDLPISPGFAALIDACTARDPRERPKSASDALFTLEHLPEYAQHKGLVQDTIEGPLLFGATRNPTLRVGPGLRAARRRRVLAVGAAVAGMLVLIAASVFAGRAMRVMPPAPPAVVGEAAVDVTVSPLGRAHAWHSGRDTAREGWVILRRAGPGEGLEGIGVLGRRILRFSGEDAGGDAVTISGLWADYADRAGAAPRYGMFEGSERLGSSDALGYTFELEFRSETDPAHWREAIFVLDAPHQQSPEALLQAVEASPAWSRLIFGEMLSRDIENRCRLAPFLFARPGQAVLALQVPAGGLARVDGGVDDLVWQQAGFQPDARDPHMAAILAPGGVALAFTAVGEVAQPRLQLSLALAHAPEDSRWRGIVVDADGVHGLEGAEGALRQDGSRVTVEVWLPVAPRGDAAWPHRDTALRINAVLRDGEAEDARQVAAWGGGVLDDLGGALLVLLNPARLESP